MAENQPIEQITAPLKEEAPVKVKDPRRVAAGKALAARNKAAREAKKQAEQAGPVHGGFGLDNVMQVAAVVGAGFTLYHGYQAVKPYLGPMRGGGRVKVPLMARNWVFYERVDTFLRTLAKK